MKLYYTYIMASLGGTLYTGVTNNIYNRVLTHKRREQPGFTQRYNITRLVYYEETGNINYAIAREKEIKGWRRSKKIALIISLNPKWKDLAVDWYAPDELFGNDL
jgi:putative endonuclease